MAVAQKLKCIVERIIDHGEHVYSLELTPERPAPRFQPGQFLHLAIDRFELGEFWPDSRVFSIASSPEDRQNIRITYSVRGKFTARMEQGLKPGEQVWVKLPYGDFVIHKDKPAVLFAGGTGVTAFTAFINSLSEQQSQHVTLFYGGRERKLLIYRDLIEQVAQSYTNLKRNYFIEKVDPGDSLGPNETLGRLSIATSWPYIQEPGECSYYYLSGPPSMISFLKQELLCRDIPSDSIFIDAW